jgi:hypothetical protein
MKAEALTGDAVIHARARMQAIRDADMATRDVMSAKGERPLLRPAIKALMLAGVVDLAFYLGRPLRRTGRSTARIEKTTSARPVLSYLPVAAFYG